MEFEKYELASYCISLFLRLKKRTKYNAGCPGYVTGERDTNLTLCWLASAFIYFNGYESHLKAMKGVQVILRENGIQVSHCARIQYIYLFLLIRNPNKFNEGRPGYVTL